MKRLILLLLYSNCVLAANFCMPLSEPVCVPDTISIHPHEDCNAYYVCKNGNLKTYECPYGEHFSTQYNLCLPENVANCNRRCLYFKEKLKLIKEWLFNLFGVENYAECPPTPTCGFFDLGLLKPYPPDCTKYIYCNTAGAGILSDCSEGLLFSASTLQCLTPDLANCKNCGEEDPTTTLEPTTEEPTTTTTEEPTTTTTEEPTTTTTEQTTVTDPPTTTTLPPCPPTPTCSFTEWGALKPYPPDCSKYIYCDLNGLADIRICLAGLHFNSREGVCTEPEIANCPLCLS